MHWGRQLVTEWETYEEKLGGKGSRYENYMALTEGGSEFSAHLSITKPSEMSLLVSHISSVLS